MSMDAGLADAHISPDARASDMVTHGLGALMPDVEMDLWHLLCLADQEFVPPLSQRSSTTDRNLTGRARHDAQPVEYWKSLRTQGILVASHEEKVSAFMSYRPSYTLAPSLTALPASIIATYVSTVIVEPSRRGHGLTESFYRHLRTLADMRSESIATRTWSTNYSHLKILDRLGFEEFSRIDDDRGAGIDTVLFLWPLQ